MRRHRIHPACRNREREAPHQHEEGVIIILVAIFMLFVIGAMAALSIDITTFYTARSEAQIAADSAALAAARVLANSGVTSLSDSTSAPPGIVAQAEALATTIATQVAQQNLIGGSTPQVAVSFNDGSSLFLSNPHVTVQVKRTDLPTFFARIWGSTQIPVSATATAEAYNPSGLANISASPVAPVAPICVKPWLLPNYDPNLGGTNPIFDSSGGIADSSLLGWSGPMTFGCNINPLTGACVPNSPTVWQYLPGDDTTFPPPTSSLPSCNPALSTNYQESIAGCIQIPISCVSPNNSPANIDVSPYPDNWNADTADAVNCLTHATSSGGGDTVTSTNPLSAPFQFVVGANNPVALVNPSLVGSYAMVSDSLVTVPVFDPTGLTSSSTSVPIIGFVQLFLNPNGFWTPDSGPTSGQVNTTVINLIGCGGTSPGTQPIIGNGPSAVAVRLVTLP